MRQVVVYAAWAYSLADPIDTVCSYEVCVQKLYQRCIYRAVNGYSGRGQAPLVNGAALTQSIEPFDSKPRS